MTLRENYVTFVVHAGNFFFSRMVLVMMESLAGSGHKYTTLRPKLGGRLDQYKFDPLGKFTSLDKLTVFPQMSAPALLISKFFFISVCSFETHLLERQRSFDLALIRYHAGALWRAGAQWGKMVCHILALPNPFSLEINLCLNQIYIISFTKNLCQKLTLDHTYILQDILHLY